MSDKRKLKKKGKNEPSGDDLDVAPSKLEMSIIKYMKNNVPTKRTRLLSHPVNYFNGSKAIDSLLDSPWATGGDPIFTTRQSVVCFMNKLLGEKFFHRAKKIAIKDKDLSAKELKKMQEKQKKKEDDDTDKDDKNEKKKKRTKIKLDMHMQQVFLDSSDAYVWIYDPVPFWYYIAGSCLVLGAIGVCLFPLWPNSVRSGAYYLSMAAAGFLGFILSMVVIRFVFFMIIWTLSIGRHHLWILPNLTEDVGFFASFWPLYSYEYKGSPFDKKKKESKKKRRHDDEEEDEAKKSDNEELESQSDGEKCNSAQRESPNETDSENSNSQAFEMVDNEDFDDEEGEEED